MLSAHHLSQLHPSKLAKKIDQGKWNLWQPWCQIETFYHGSIIYLVAPIVALCPPLPLLSIVVNVVNLLCCDVLNYHKINHQWQINQLPSIDTFHSTWSQLIQPKMYSAWLRLPLRFLKRHSSESEWMLKLKIPTTRDTLCYGYITDMNYVHDIAAFSFPWTVIFYIIKMICYSTKHQDSNKVSPSEKHVVSCMRYVKHLTLHYQEFFNLHVGKGMASTQTTK